MCDSVDVDLAHILERLFPAACLACGAVDKALCGACLRDASRPQRFVAGGVPGFALGAYAGTLRRAVLAVKRGRRDVADALGEALCERFGAALPRDAVLVPVPTGARRRASRGFDQAVLLARRAGDGTGLPVLCALREVAGGAQHGRSRADRLAPRERFACSATLVAGVRAVLVDDVVTTGGTLRDCAAALRGRGGRIEGALVVARALAGAGRRSGEPPKS